MWIFIGFIKVPLLCLFCLMKDTVDSVQLSAPEVVTASSGGSVTVSCQYDLTFRENTKYWCKGAVYDFCVIVVTTSKNPIRDRSSIADDKEEGVFSVTVESFGKSDEGMYWCVISTPGRNIHKAVRLLVSHTVTFTTPTSLSVENDDTSWWATLRWILFILMLCCLVSTHITVWRIKAAKKISQQQQFQNQTSNVYQ
ncbi:CMRF35-like molecule 1 [Anabas testudineus]|uniref:CMRF35-like molecule 1 n=1 Tax=Anabas testudineus TaxID=64144 RepID=UPI000E459C5F|nr:CMRF35-like molecule 1 [Anabas testudineus]